MVVNFRAREISRDARKLARTPTLNKKKMIKQDWMHDLDIPIIRIIIDHHSIILL
jgi:hypothetical protein